jgi:aminopeptidase N
MIRQLLGDEKFFNALRRFYTDSRFTKVGSDDFQLALEQETGRPFSRFFDTWVYGSAIPRVGLSYKVEADAGGKQEAVLHFEQGEDYGELPVVVTLQYADRRSVDVVVPVLAKIVDYRVPLDGTLRSADVNRDQTTAEIVKLTSP